MNTYALGNLTLIALINKPPNLSGLTIEVCFSLMSHPMLRYLVDGLLCDIPGPRFFLSWASPWRLFHSSGNGEKRL